MATIYFDIKKSEFYTEARSLYPFDFTSLGSTVRTRLETFITSVDSFHIGTIGDVITFTVTDANKNVIKISSAPFEVDQDNDDASVYRVKYGYVAMIPRNVLNGRRLFRSWIYDLSQVQKLQNTFQSSDNVQVVSITANAVPVLDITYRNEYNTFSAIVEFKLKKL